jgi:hypothetical protein
MLFETCLTDDEIVSGGLLVKNSKSSHAIAVFEKYNSFPSVIKKRGHNAQKKILYLLQTTSTVTVMWLKRGCQISSFLLK